MENAPATSNTDAAAKLKEIKELVDLTYKLKKESDLAEKAYNKAKGKLAEIMENAECDKMSGDECNASLKLKTSVTLPKEHHLKLQVLEYMAKADNEQNEEGGKEVIQTLNKLFKLSPTLADKLTIHAGSFSSWHTAEIERKAAEGDFEFKVPAVSPYEYYSVGLRARAQRKK